MMKLTKSNVGHWILMVAMVFLGAGCGDDAGGTAGTGGMGGTGGTPSGDGNLQVVLGAEETIPEGLQSGAGDEAITDGFNVSFDSFIISVGNVRMSQAGGGEVISSDVLVVDLTALPAAGLTLTSFNDIPTGDYVNFGYETPIPTAGATRDASVSEADFDMMVAQGWSYLIRGTLTDDGGTPGNAADDGQVVDQDFLIGADVPSVYTACGVEDAPEPGVTVTANSSAEATIHGDHIFFNGFPEGDEGGVVRQAAWMTMITDDGDGVLTRTDFEAATDVGTLFPVPPAGDYTLTGGPLASINNAWDFVRAELGTSGHIQGEGECEFEPLTN